MSEQTEKFVGLTSIELLHHFCCAHCEKWWSIGDAAEGKTEWYCPWCGTQQEFEVMKTTDDPILPSSKNDVQS